MTVQSIFTAKKRQDAETVALRSPAQFAARCGLTLELLGQLANIPYYTMTTAPSDPFVQRYMHNIMRTVWAVKGYLADEDASWRFVAHRPVMALGGCTLLQLVAQGRTDMAIDHVLRTGHDAAY